MTNRQIQQMHEIRMMLVQVVMPTVVVGGYILSRPDVKYAIKNKVEQVKANVKKRFN